MNPSIMIISDGTSHGTQIKVGEQAIKGVTKIEIFPIVAMGTVKARLTFDLVALRLKAEVENVGCIDSLTSNFTKKALVEL